MRLSLVLLLLAAWLVPAGAHAQASPLLRAISASSATRDCVRLTLRSSLAGEQAISQGERASVHRFERCDGPCN